MANLIPNGLDSTTGQKTTLKSGDALVNSSGKSLGFPTKYIEGLVIKVQGASATSLSVTAGSCRDKNDTSDMILSSVTTASSTTGHSGSDGLATLNGVDEKGLDNLSTGSITCSQSGTTITATGDITPHLGTRAITGTITTSGTTVTGTGTSFTSEVWPGDLIGSSTTYGWSRVDHVVSDTSIVLDAALPGGDATGISATVIHSATIWPGTTTSNKQKITTINAAGTSIGVDISATIAASSALTIGVLPDNNFADTATQWTWVFVWLISDGTTSGLLLSTQHENLLAPPSGYIYCRRIGVVLWNDAEDAPGFLVETYYRDGANYRYVDSLYNGFYDPPVGTTNVYPNNSDVFSLSFAPRTAKQIRVKAALGNTVDTAEALLNVRRRGGSSNRNVMLIQRKTNASDQPRNSVSILDIDVDDGQGFDWIVTGAGASVRITCYGYWDQL